MHGQAPAREAATGRIWTWRWLGGCSGWEGNDTWEELAAWGWRGESRKLVVVNLGGGSASGHVSLPWDELRGRARQLEDTGGGERYERSGMTSATASTSRSSHGTSENAKSSYSTGMILMPSPS